MKTRINLIVAIILMCIVHLNTGWNETVDQNIQAEAALKKTDQSNPMSISGEMKGDVKGSGCPCQGFKLLPYGKEIWSSDAFNMHFLNSIKSYQQLTPIPLCPYR